MTPEDRKLQAEMDDHLRAHAADLEAQGLPPAEAMRQARIAFGSVESIKEECRDQRPGNWLFDLGRDMHYAWRMLRRSPVLAATAVLSLGLGIGANTAIFTIIDCLMLRSLPVERPEELFAVKWQSKKHPDDAVIRSANGSSQGKDLMVANFFSVASYDAIRAKIQVAGFLEPSSASVRVDGPAETARVQLVSGNYYSLLGVNAYRGRLLLPSDDEANATPTAVVSHRFWRKHPEIVGTSIRINNREFQVVGATPPEFFGHEIGVYPDIATPLRQSITAELSSPLFWWVKLIGRFETKPDLEPLNALLVHSLVATPSSADTTPALRLEPAADSLSGLRRQFSEPLRILMLMVALVLFIASANVANLLLARAVAREKEIQIRLALGASVSRLTRQFLAEFLLLALLGAAFSLGIAYALVQAILPLVPGRGEIALLDNSPLNLRILGFTTSVSLFITILFGLWPARQAAKTRLVTGSPKRFSGALVVMQVALATVLVLGAGFFVKSLRNLNDQPLGFLRERLLLFSVNVLQTGTPSAAAGPFYLELQRRIRQLPGVSQASASLVRPMTDGGYYSRIILPDKKFVQAALHPSLPGFQEALGVGLRAGRMLTASDPLDRVVINETLARKVFGQGNPVGASLQLGGRPPFKMVEVVGVARDARYERIRGDIPGVLYRLLDPATDFRGGALTFAVRTAQDPNKLLPEIRKIASDMNHDMPLVDVRTLDEQVDDLLRQERLFALLCGGFAGLALLLAALGLFGVLAYRVNRRQTELGIRLALGAPRFGLWRMVLMEGWRWLAIGTAAGVLAAYQGVSYVQSFLYGLQAAEFQNWVTPLATLFLVGTAAIAIPAWRACRVDPMVALRND